MSISMSPVANVVSTLLLGMSYLPYLLLPCILKVSGNPTWGVCVFALVVGLASSVADLDHGDKGTALICSVAGSIVVWLV